MKRICVSKGDHHGLHRGRPAGLGGLCAVKLYNVGMRLVASLQWVKGWKGLITKPSGLGCVIEIMCCHNVNCGANKTQFIWLWVLMVQVLTFSIEDPSWSVVNVSQKTIQAYAKKYMILKVGPAFGFVVFDMVGPEDKTEGGPYYIPSSFPFMLPLYRSQALYVVKAKVSPKVPTGWISNRRLAWKNTKLVSIAEDDIQTIQAQWHGLSIREAMQRVLEQDWQKTPLDRDEDSLVGIGIIETLDDEVDSKEDYGEDGAGEETIDDWLEEEVDDEVDGDGDGDGDGDDLEDDDVDGDGDDIEDEEGVGDIDAEIPMDDGSNSEDGFDDED